MSKEIKLIQDWYATTYNGVNTELCTVYTIPWSIRMTIKHFGYLHRLGLYGGKFLLTLILQLIRKSSVQVRNQFVIRFYENNISSLFLTQGSLATLGDYIS